MIGYSKATTNTGYPYGNKQAPRSFERRDVAAFGKQATWGDNCTLFWVRLHDGTELHVRANQQAKPDEKWFRKLSKHTPSPYCSSRVQGWSFVWRDVTDAERAA